MTKILTLNLANYDDHSNWEERLAMCVQTIAQTLPDVIALQEVRFNPDRDSTKLLYQNMGEQVLYELNQVGCYEGGFIVTLPAMYYPSMLGQDPTRYQYYPGPSSVAAWQEWEGLSLISRLPVLETGARYLTQSGTSDPNRRITQYVAVQTTSGNRLNVYNCHFSYDSWNLSSNIAETLEWLQPASNRACLLVGDLNAVPTDPALAQLQANGFRDLWTLLNPSEVGYTAPSSCPTKRIDYIWSSSELQREQMKGIELVATVPNAQGIYASDHFGVLAEIDY